MDDIYDAMLRSVIRYKDKYLIPSLSSPEFMEEFEKMEVRKDDIFIITYPKSGTHWMQEIVHLILHDGQVEKLSASHRRCVAEVADVITPLPQLKAATGSVLQGMKDDPSPRVITTHCQYELLPRQLHEKPVKVIYVYRNPKDALVSRYNFTLKVAEIKLGKPVRHSTHLFSSFFDVLTSGNYAYGSWFDHVNEYWKHSDNLNTFFVSYEEMKKDLGSVVKEIGQFLCHPLNEDGIRDVVHNASLGKMRSSFHKDQIQHIKEGKEVIDRNFFINKGEINQWQKIFTIRQNEVFDELLMEKMKGCDLAKAYLPITGNLQRLDTTLK